MKISQKSLKSSLEKTLEKYKANESETGNAKRLHIINTLSKEFKDWCPEGELLPIGSYRLGVHSPESDLDLICVSPNQYSRDDFQQVFFVRLQNLKEVCYCYGIFTAKVPIIKLIMSGIKIDIQFASTDQDLKTVNVLELDEASLLGINAYKTNEFLLSAVPSIENFQKLSKAIRLWAKQRNLYSAVNGCLGGISWNILCAKICIIYPNLSWVELVEKFFKVYSVWDWTVAVNINPNESFYAFSSRDQMMTIMTPVSPCYNSAYSLISSSFSCIVNELEQGNKVVKEIMEGNLEWESLFEEVDFFQQYRYFIRVSINTYTEAEYETWSGLVFSRIKYLLQDLERVYPRPVVNLYNKAFDGHCKQFKCCSNYYIGLRFSFAQCVKLDLRSPINSFCSVLNEIRPNKTTMCLRVAFVPRKDFVNEKQMNS